MSYYVGIDLHSDNNFIGIIDKKDCRILSKKLPNDLDMVLNTLKPFKRKIKGVVVESTYNWYWLVDGLMDKKYNVHLANPSQMQQYSGMKYTDDKWDSFWLAHMLRLGILPEGYIYPKDIRPIRDLLRKRMMLVQHRTAYILSLQSMVNRNTGWKLKARETKKLDEGELNIMFSDKHLVMSAQSNCNVMEFLDGQIDVIVSPFKFNTPWPCHSRNDSRLYSIVKFIITNQGVTPDAQEGSLRGVRQKSLVRES